MTKLKILLKRFLQFFRKKIYPFPKGITTKQIRLPNNTIFIEVLASGANEQFNHSIHSEKYVG